MELFDKYELEEYKGETINGLPCKRGSVLMFVPGLNDIGRVESYLREEYSNLKLEFEYFYLLLNQLILKNDLSLRILTLHSDFSVDKQKEVFKECAAGVRKVIISTSIAESSITVPDVKYVVDFCLTKSLYCDQDATNYTSLRLEWATKSSMDQR